MLHHSLWLNATSEPVQEDAVAALGNGSKYGSTFDIVAEAAGREVIWMTIKAQLMNAICERFVGSAHRACLDHMLIFGERQLYRVIQAYVDYFNRTRPH